MEGREVWEGAWKAVRVFSLVKPAQNFRNLNLEKTHLGLVRKPTRYWLRFLNFAGFLFSTLDIPQNLGRSSYFQPQPARDPSGITCRIALIGVETVTGLDFLRVFKSRVAATL